MNLVDKANQDNSVIFPQITLAVNSTLLLFFIQRFYLLLWGVSLSWRVKVKHQT